MRSASQDGAARPGVEGRPVYTKSRPTDRYPFTSAEDAGLGAEEFEGSRRFTRPCERILSTSVTALQVDDDVLDPRVRLRMLDRAADLLHDVVLETPRSDEHRNRLRDLASAVKDTADMFARTHNLRTDLSGQEEGPGSVAADSEAGRSTHNPIEEKN